MRDHAVAQAPADGVEPASKRVSWLELFFDLVFVAAVGQVGHQPGGAHGIEGVVRYVFLLVLIWWAWHGYVGHATRFDPDTTRARVCTLLQMVAVIFMAANAEDTLGSVSTAGFVAAYGVMRWLLAAQYAGECSAALHVGFARTRTVGLVVAGLVWLTSAVLPVPARYACWGVALLVEARLEGQALAAAVESPPHADHLPERFGLFTLILLGEALVSVMRGIQEQPVWSVPAASLALGALGMIFLVWWAYFEHARATAARPVTTRDDVRHLVRWTYAHLPLYLGIAVAGVDAAGLIRNGSVPSVADWQVGRGAGALLLVAVALALLSTGGTRAAEAPPSASPGAL